MENNECNCEFCLDLDRYKWAVIMNCPCRCHSDDGVSGHSSLCCEIPNGLKENNPYPELVNDKEVCIAVIEQFNDRWHEGRD